MKILFAIKRLEDAAGGAERIFIQVSGALAEKGYSIEIISFDRLDARSFYPVSGKTPWHKIPIGDSAKPARLIETLLRIIQLRKRIKEIKPDIIVAFQSSMMIPATLTFCAPPVIGSEHIIPMHYQKKPFLFAFVLLAMRLCKKVTVISPSILTMFPRFLQDRMRVVDNPILTHQVTASPAGKEGERKILLSVGRLEEQKDHQTLIKAFSLINHDFPEWDLVIRGEGSLRQKLEKNIQDLGLKKRIFLPGNSSEIMEDYKKAQIFVLASRYESFGLVVAEAMSANLPTIGFDDCFGLNQLIKNGKNGILVTPEPGIDGRAKSLAKGLSTLMGDADLRRRYGHQGQIDAQRYDLKNVVKTWEELIVSTAEENKKSV